MTQMMIRPLTTENRLLRATGGAQLRTSMGTALGAVFDTPTMGGLALDAAARSSARPDLPEEAATAFMADEMARDQERWQLQAELADPALGEARKQEIYTRFSELGAAGDAQLSGFEKDQIAAGRLRDPVALAEKYGDLGLKFDRPMSEEEARLLAEGKRAEIIRNALIEAGPKGVVPGVAKFGVALLGMAADPLEVATMFIPVVGQAGKAGAIARFGRVGGRVAVGAVEGGVGQALTEPFYYSLSRSAQLDYDMADSLMNIGLGFVFGGGVGAIGGVFARREPDVAREIEAPRAEAPGAREALDPGLQRQAADLAMRQFVNGQPIDIARLIDGRDLRSSTTLSRTESGVTFQATQTLTAPQAREMRPTFLVAGPDGTPMRLATIQKADALAQSVGGIPLRQGDAFVVRQPADGDFVRRPNGKPLTFATQRAAEKFLTEARTMPPSARVLQVGPRAFAISRDISDASIAQMRALPDSIEIPDGVNTREIAVLPDAAARIRDAARGTLAARTGLAEAVASARAPGPLENVDASREAGIRLPDDFLPRDMEHWEAMVRQMADDPSIEAELLAIRDIEERAALFAEVAEAAATCLARTA